MSVDIEEMAMHLDKRRTNEVKEQYDQRHTNATAAFLLCFFLGFLGAHRFYLGQWRSGLAHLTLFVLGAVSVIFGFLSTAPLNATLFVVGGALILACLIWEIVDLGRIDNEIHHRNLLLAEGLIAGALLSDTSAVEEAMSKLDEAVQTVAAQSLAASGPTGVISREELEQARALAEESGRAEISYHEISSFVVSETPEERAGASALSEPVTTSERHVTTEPLPAGSEATPVVEAQTHTHSDDGLRVTDVEETNRVSGPTAAEAIALDAGALGVAAVGLGMAETAQAHEAPASDQAPDITPTPVMAPEPEPTVISAPEPVAASAAEPVIIPALEPVAAESPATPQVEEGAAPATPAGPVAPRIGGDVTDAAAPDFVPLASDIAYASAYPSYLTLPEQPAPTTPGDASEGYMATRAETSADVTEPDIPVYIAAQETEPETAPTSIPPTAPEPPAESYVPPVPDVYSASAPRPEAYTPSWEAQTATMAATPSQHSVEPEPVAAEAVAAEPVATEPVTVAAEPVAAEPVAVEPATADEPAAPKMKRIRVKHRIVVEGQVVREETVEREVPADMDMALAARQIQEELERSATATPDEIARLANLSADEEVEVRRHIEGLGQ